MTSRPFPRPGNGNAAGSADDPLLPRHRHPITAGPTTPRAKRPGRQPCQPQVSGHQPGNRPHPADAMTISAPRSPRRRGRDQ